jgi:hypothetical protein
LSAQDDRYLLDAFAKSAQDAPVKLPPRLRANILADAAGVLNGAAPEPTTFNATIGGRIASRFATVFHDWAGMGGLAAAGLAGLWLGYAPPTMFGDPFEQVFEARISLDIYDSQSWEYLDGMIWEEQE